MKLTNLKGEVAEWLSARLESVYGKLYRGFESRSLRHLRDFIFQKKKFFSKNSV